MHVRGLRDIKTHGTLAREGRLVSVARNLHRLGNGTEENTSHSSDWNIERHVYKKKKSANTATAIPLHRELYLERKVRLYQIAIIKSLLVEFQQATIEGLPVALHELERLKMRLTELQTE